MRAFIGCDSDLTEGQLVVTGHHLEVRMVVIRPVTEEEAQESARALGLGPLVIVPGERFYEVEYTTLPIGSQN